MGASTGVVISLHGIRTRGEWQDLAAEVVSDQGFVYCPLKYGYFDCFSFWLNGLLKSDRKLTWFLKEYETRLERHQKHLGGDVKRHPSAIAHSFGTWIVANAMLKYRAIRFEKLILCASILPRDFPWDTLLDRGQVGYVRHEYGAKDIWPKVANLLVPGTGDSGSAGFSTRHPRIEQDEFTHYKHSDFFTRSHLEENWTPTLHKKLARFVVRQGRDITTLDEWVSLRPDTVEIDAKAFGHLPGYDQVSVDEQQLHEWYQVEPDIWTFIADGRSKGILGYINALPVKPKHYERLLKAGMPDRAITPDVLASYGNGGDVCLCVISVAINRDAIGTAEKSTAVRMLLTGFCDKLEYLAKQQGVRVLEVGAVGWTPEGERVCDLLGLESSEQTNEGRPLYRFRMAKEIQRDNHHYPAIKRLMRTYRELSRKNSWTWSAAPAE